MKTKSVSLVVLITSFIIILFLFLSNSFSQIDAEIYTNLKENQGLESAVQDTIVYYDDEVEKIVSKDNYHSNCQSSVDSTKIIEAMCNSNPFAAILLEYFSESVENPYPMFTAGGNTFSNLVDIDGNGTQGVLAIRSEVRHAGYGLVAPGINEFVAIYRPVTVGRVFYLYNGEVFYTDIGMLEGFPYSVDITANGRIVKVTGDGGNWSYTLFGMESGRLVPTLTIYGELASSDIYPFYAFDYFLYSGGESEGWQNRKSITEEEFNEIRIRYGLDNLAWLREDETAQILAMNFE